MKTAVKVSLATACILVGFPPTTIKPEPAVAATFKMQPMAFAEYKVKALGWSTKQMTCLSQLWNRESHWNPLSRNSTPVYQFRNGKRVALHAQGVAQLLGEKSFIPSVQVTHGLTYIKSRYGSPCNAWSFWQSRARNGVGWY